MALVRSSVESPPTDHPPPGTRWMTMRSETRGPSCTASTSASPRSTSIAASETSTPARSIPHSVATTSPAGLRTGTPTYDVTPSCSRTGASR
jgi:hypothetical protein